jgi:NTP pyrophosphatase (non-canonical NTP hydrolase)
MGNLSEHYDKSLVSALQDVHAEVDRAKGMFNAAFNGFHEGYAVMLEEVDEVWDEVKKKVHNKDKLRKELIQVAAMAMRMVVELTPPKQ